MILTWLEEMMSGRREGGVATANTPSVFWLQPPLGDSEPWNEGEANGAGPLLWASDSSHFWAMPVFQHLQAEILKGALAAV